MIIRYLIECATCNTALTLRIGINDNAKQQHSFLCPNCKESIVVILELDKKNSPETLNLFENCKLGKDEGIIINLHPEFLIPENKLHQDGFSAAVDGAKKLYEKQLEFLEERGINLDDLVRDKDVISKIRESTISVDRSWAIIKKSWSLEINGNNDLARKNLQQYKDYNFEPTMQLNEVLFHFFKTLTGPRGNSLTTNALDKIMMAHDLNSSEFKKFKSFFLSELQGEHYVRFYQIFSEYFKNYSDYSQTLGFVIWSIANDKDVPASINFSDTKMFYGNAFEELSSIFIVLACINNILQGRSYDEFEGIIQSSNKILKRDMKGYTDTTKSQRICFFKETPEFYALAVHMDNHLRNSSHHKSMALNGHAIICRDNNKTFNIPYDKYLRLCNELMISLAVMLKIELVLSYQSH